jgi:hypothetical protein
MLMVYLICLYILDTCGCCRLELTKFFTLLPLARSRHTCLVVLLTLVTSIASTFVQLICKLWRRIRLLAGRGYIAVMLVATYLSIRNLSSLSKFNIHRELDLRSGKLKSLHTIHASKLHVNLLCCQRPTTMCHSYSWHPAIVSLNRFANIGTKCNQTKRTLQLRLLCAVPCPEL